MKAATVIAVLLTVLACAAYADTEIPRYHVHSEYLLTSPGSMGYGLYGYVNPAVLKQVEHPDLLFAWSGESDDFEDFDRWGLFAAVTMPRLGFGVIRDQGPLGTINDYRLSVAFGDRTGSLGIGYGWSAGDTDAYGRGNVVTVGSLMRPNRFLSIGLSGIFATSGSAREGLLDVGIRPLGNELVTVFGDYAPQDDDILEEAPWSSGIAVEPLPGVRMTGRYFGTHEITVGLNLSLGRLGLASQARTDADRARSYNTYSLRLGALDRSFLRAYAQRDRKYLHLNLTGPLKYQRFRMFDKSKTLLDLLAAIDAAKEDDTVAGIAINTSDMGMNWEMAWEVREALKDFRAAGKKVVVYIDDANLARYHFASIADRIVMDPISDIMLLGMRGGRFYLKGTLEKLGVGFDEWRFFKYKSAYETFSRDSMSEGDQEQIEKIVDDFYLLAKTEVCEDRGIPSDEFDRLVDDELLIRPERAMELGLADTTGRWETVKDVIEELEGEKKDLVGVGALAKYELPRDYWGDRPKIAVIYGLGVCAMDEGIKARSLEKVFDRVAGAKDIRAVVFRVDSPGGSALASDVVAEAMKRCKKKKPLIVSQGYVAGSGGYWISMYGDTIVAAPNTITGSIGVIGGWFYNQGLKERLGMSTDLVKVGKHADLGYGVPLPLVGSLPDRDVTEDERAVIEDNIRHYYKMFVEMVASGRHMEYDQVNAIGQGRVWSGSDGLDVGLVDVLGGLETAIMIAKQKAGIPVHQEVDIVELPEPPLLNPEMFAPKLFGVEVHRDPVIEHLRFRIEHNGEPMPLLPMEYMSPEVLDVD